MVELVVEVGLGCFLFGGMVGHWLARRLRAPSFAPLGKCPTCGRGG